MKRMLLTLLAVAALASSAPGHIFRPAVRLNMYGGYRPYYGVYTHHPFRGPLYYPPPGYSAPFPVCPPMVAPSQNMNTYFGR